MRVDARFQDIHGVVAIFEECATVLYACSGRYFITNKLRKLFIPIKLAQAWYQEQCIQALI